MPKSIIVAMSRRPLGSSRRTFFRDVRRADHVAWVLDRAGVDAVVMTNDPFDAREVREWDQRPVFDGRFRTSAASIIATKVAPRNTRRATLPTMSAQSNGDSSCRHEWHDFGEPVRYASRAASNLKTAATLSGLRETAAAKA